MRESGKSERYQGAEKELIYGSDVAKKAETVLVQNAEWLAQVAKVEHDSERVLLEFPTRGRKVVWFIVHVKRIKVEVGSWDGSKVVVNRVKKVATVYFGSCSQAEDSWRFEGKRELSKDWPAIRKEISKDGRVATRTLRTAGPT